MRRAMRTILYICEEGADRFYHRTQYIETFIRFELYSSSSTTPLSLSKSLHTCTSLLINPYLTYHRAPGVISVKIEAKRIAPNGTPRFAASHLGLHCLPLSHKKDPRLI